MTIGLELPTLLKNNYASNTFGMGELWASSPTTTGGMLAQPTTTTATTRRIQQKTTAMILAPEQEQEVADQLRVVKVFIADTNKNIPVNKRLIYIGEETTTELTDQELFFEIDIKGLLDSHNKYRVTVKDKKESTKENIVTLEPVRIKDLKMTVVDIATF